MKKGWLFFGVLLSAVIAVVYFKGGQAEPQFVAPHGSSQSNFDSKSERNSAEVGGLKDTSRVTNLEIPLMNSKAPILCHLGYAFQYAEDHEQAYWIAYELTKSETEKSYSRTDHFIPDPLVISGSATQSDYAGSGFDRGHLAPAADMAWSKTAMEESFYFSNMSPQVPSFNRGIWKRLEEQVRSWAIVYDHIYIVTGPVLTEGLATIGPNKVSVPKYYYKVILDNSGKDQKAIGFLMENATGNGELDSYAVTVDRVEQVTGIDFFNKLPDAIETKVEREICLPCWTWSLTQTPKGTANDEEGEPQAPFSDGSKIQCKGITKAGKQCSRSCSDGSGYCFQHHP